MPGKVNPVIPEAIGQLCFKIIGNDSTITLASQSGQLELNAFEPVIFDCMFENLELLINGTMTFRTKCIDGLTVNKKVCKNYVENSTSIITSACPIIGYKKSANLAKKALKENKTIKQVLLEDGTLSSSQIKDILNYHKMI